MYLDLNHPWLYLTTSAFTLLMGFYAWKQPRRPGSMSFLWMTIAWSIGALASAVMTTTSSSVLRYAAWVVEYASIIIVSPIQLLLAVKYTGYGKVFARRNVLALMMLPGLIFALAACIFPDRMAYVDLHFGGQIIYTQEAVKWWIYAYIFGILLINLWVYFICLLRAPAFAFPILLFVLGLLAPRAAVVLINPETINVSPLQATLLLTFFSAACFSAAMFGFQMLQVPPVARDTAIYHMPFAMIVLDARRKVVDFNPAAQLLPGLPARMALRQPAERALGSWWEHIAPLIGPQAVEREITLQHGIDTRYFHVYSLPLTQAGGWNIGQVCLILDITQARQAQHQQAQALWAQATLQEREQLANELHDGLSQNLAFLNLQAQTANIYLQAGKVDTAQETLLRLSEAAEKVQDETRQMIGNLLSISLPAENFCAALRQILANFEQNSGLETRLDIDPGAAIEVDKAFGPSRLTPQVAVQLIRITQEALTNIRKHAPGASRVSVTLTERQGKACLSIEDDGAGFDPQAAPGRGHHYGLQVMRQRAARIGGQVHITSAPQKGARVEVCVPLVVDETRGGP